MNLPEKYPQEPKHLWEQFFNFSQIPRPSKKELKILDYLKNLAVAQKLEYKQDKEGNIVIYVPGRGANKDKSPVIIQNHVDMVTDSLATKQINFETDPIELIVEKDWLRADGTTLGADNGIGCAAALGMIFETDGNHPPLELLFTVDEETGLNGALNLDSNMLSGTRMLNLDTEEWGSIYMGCAGGIDYELTGQIPKQMDLNPLINVKVDVHAFSGGHSGVDIHEQKGNAIKYLSQLLNRAYKHFEFNLVEIRGGRAHNIIPREAFAIIGMNEQNLEKLSIIAQELRSEWLGFLPEKDRSFVVNVEAQDVSSAHYLSSEKTKDICELLNLFPHGVHSYQDTKQNLVSCSNNLARVLLVRGEFYLQSSLRFLDRNEVKKLEEIIQILGDKCSLKVESHSEYPSWKPNLNSNLLGLAKTVYQDCFDEIPRVTAIHAGLECGIKIDVISFGPTITGAHSPDERVHIPSVTHFWKYLKALLKEM